MEPGWDRSHWRTDSLLLLHLFLERVCLTRDEHQLKNTRTETRQDSKVLPHKEKLQVPGLLPS